MLRYIINLLFLFGSLVVLAQNSDSTKTSFSLDKLKPQSFRVGIDGLGLIRTAVRPSLQIIEGKFEADLRKYIGVFEFGTFSHRIDSLPRYDYKVQGSFWRVGIDVNLLHKAPDKSVFSFGLRYGRAVQSDNIDFSINDPVYGFMDGFSYANNKVRAGWVEMVTGLQVQIHRNLWMGYSARFKFGLKYDFQNFEPFEISGYGRSNTLTVNNTTWGFNYYLIFNLPLGD